MSRIEEVVAKLVCKVKSLIKCCENSISVSDNEDCEFGGFIATNNRGEEVYRYCNSIVSVEDNEGCDNGFIVRDPSNNVIYTYCPECCTDIVSIMDNEECETKGFKVLDKLGEVIYSFCQECCGQESISKIVFYTESRSELSTLSETPDLDDTTSYKTQANYTITAGDGDGLYELDFTSGLTETSFPPGAEPIHEYGIYINDTLLDPTHVQSVSYSITESVDPAGIPTRWFQSQIPLQVGDTIGIYLAFDEMRVQHWNMIIRKVG